MILPPQRTEPVAVSANGMVVLIVDATDVPVQGDDARLLVGGLLRSADCAAHKLAGCISRMRLVGEAADTVLIEPELHDAVVMAIDLVGRATSGLDGLREAVLRAATLRAA